MRSLKIILLLIIGYMVVFPSSLSAELSTAQFEIIKVAFINGYASAINADMEIIKALKEDKVKLKEYAQLAVDGYMKQVSSLNQEGMVASNKK